MKLQSLIQPQDIEVFYIMPTLRKELALELKRSGLNQNKIADLLHIKKSTVSQYINNKRGSKVSFSNNIKKEISSSAHEIHDTLTLIRETQKILRSIRHSGELCRIHKQLSDIPGECNPELVNCFGGEENV